MRHKEIQAEVTELQQEVSELEKEKELLVEERKKELLEQCRREGWINGVNLPEDELDKLCRRYLVTEITATLNHRKKLENKLAQYEPEIVALEKRFQQQQVQAQLIAIQSQLQQPAQPQVTPQSSPKVQASAPGPPQQPPSQQQPLNMNKEKKNLSRSRSQEWPDIPDMAKIDEKNPELLAKKIIETARGLEAAGKAPKKGGGNPSAAMSAETGVPSGIPSGGNSGRRKSGSGPSTVELPTVQLPQPPPPPPPVVEKQQNIPAPKVSFFEDRLKNLITSVLNEESPSSSSENHTSNMPVPMAHKGADYDHHHPHHQQQQQQHQLKKQPPPHLQHQHPPHPSQQHQHQQQHHNKNMHHHHHSPSHSRHPPMPQQNSQYPGQNHPHHPPQHHQAPPHHHSQPHVIPINVPLNPLLPHQSKSSSSMMQPSQQISPAAAQESQQNMHQGQKRKTLQLSPDITNVPQNMANRTNPNMHPQMHMSPQGKAAMKNLNHLTVTSTPLQQHENHRAVRNLSFNQSSSSSSNHNQGQQGPHPHQEKSGNNNRTISDMMTSEIETSLGIAPRKVWEGKVNMCTASPPVRGGIGPYSPISRPNSNENIPEALAYGSSRASVLVHPPRSSAGSERGSHHGPSQGDDSLMNEGLAAGLKARIISMAKSSAINLENKVDGSGGRESSSSGGNANPSTSSAGNSSSQDKSQPASTTILLSSPLVKEKKVVESPSGGVTVEVVLGSSDGADEMDVDRSDNGNASVLRVIRKRVSDPTMNVSKKNYIFLFITKSIYIT